MPNLAENCYPEGMTTPKWLQWAGIAVVVAVLALFLAGMASAGLGKPTAKGYQLLHGRAFYCLYYVKGPKSAPTAVTVVCKYAPKVAATIQGPGA